MSKAAECSITKPAKCSTDDAELLALVRQFTTAWNEWGRLDDDDIQRSSKLCAQCADLQFQIVLMPAHTSRGLAGKRRVIRLAQLEQDSQGFFEWVLARDAERVGVKRPGRPRKTDTCEQATTAR